MTTATAALVIAVLAIGTYLMRLAGVVLADRVTLPAPARRLLPLAAVALLAALAATAALTDAGEWAGVARPAGVLVGVVLAWPAGEPGRRRRLPERWRLRRPFPFAVVVIAAAATAAGLRLLGLP